MTPAELTVTLEDIEAVINAADELVKQTNNAANWRHLTVPELLRIAPLDKCTETELFLLDKIGSLYDALEEANERPAEED